MIKGTNRGRVSVFSSIVNEFIPEMPELTGNKSSRVVTKHFTNLAMYLPADELSLISWLIYQCGADNTFKYSQFLLTKYSHTLLAVKEHYAPHLIRKHGHIPASDQLVRDVLERLIRKGYVLADGRKLFMISPMLTYRADYITTEQYTDICNSYSKLQPEKEHVRAFIKKFSEIINRKYKKK